MTCGKPVTVLFHEQEQRNIQPWRRHWHHHSSVGIMDPVALGPLGFLARYLWMVLRHMLGSGLD